MNLRKILFLALLIISLVLIGNAAIQQTSEGSMELKINVADDQGYNTVSRMVKLKNIKASEVEPFIKARLSRYGVVQTNDALNMLIVTDMESKVNDLVKVIQGLDDEKLKDFLRLKTEIVPLKYLKASDIVGYVSKELSAEGLVMAKDDQNILIIKDYESKVELALNLIEKLDLPLKQVEIKVEIVEFEDGQLSEIGFDWREVLKNLNLGYNQTNYHEKETYTHNDINNKYRRNETIHNSNINFSNNNLEKIINAFVDDNKAKKLYSSNLVAQNGKTAKIKTGYSIGNLNYDRETKDTGLGFLVTPYFGESDIITLKINAHSTNLITTSFSYSNPVITDGQEIDTTVSLKNGQSYAIGGLKKSYNKTHKSGLPVLRDIPILEIFFSKKVEETFFNDIVIFITPTIIDKDKTNNNQSPNKTFDSY